MKYRKKPVEIEAVLYPLNEYEDGPYNFSEMPDWLREAIDTSVVYGDFRGEDYWYLVIRTLEGNMTVTPGDYIIQGVSGELYPCKPDIFAITYDQLLGSEET